MLVLVLIAIKKISFTGLLNNKPSQHVYFGAIVALLLLWKIKAGISPGLGFHHLGAMMFTLMFGWPLALLGISSIMLISVLLQHHEVLSLGINGLLSVALPVFVSYGILRLSQERLPDNFLYLYFCCRFFRCRYRCGSESPVGYCIIKPAAGIPGQPTGFRVAGLCSPVYVS